MRITHTETIAAPVETVFHCLEDNERLKQWMEGVEEIAYPDGPDAVRGVGTRFRMTIRQGGRSAGYDGQVLAFEPPRHLAIEMGNAQFLSAVDYRLAPDPLGTRLDYAVEVTLHTMPARIMSVLFGWLTRRIVRKQLAALKKLAESLPP